MNYSNKLERSSPYSWCEKQHRAPPLGELSPYKPCWGKKEVKIASFTYLSPLFLSGKVGIVGYGSLSCFGYPVLHCVCCGNDI